MGSIPEALPSDGSKGTPASRASTAFALARFGAFSAFVLALPEKFVEKFIEEFLFVEDGKVFAQFVHVERSAVDFQ